MKLKARMSRVGSVGMFHENLKFLGRNRFTVFRTDGRTDLYIKRQSCPCALTEHHAMKVYWGVKV
jgi:hypothetical protein